MVDRVRDHHLVRELEESVSYIRTCLLSIDEAIRLLIEYRNIAGHLTSLCIAPQKS
jgi:hypothetical protein